MWHPMQLQLWWEQNRSNWRTIWNWIYFTWPLRKQAAYRQATRGPTAVSPFQGTKATRTKCLAQGHYCRCQQIRTGDLTIESPWSYPLSHNSSSEGSSGLIISRPPLWPLRHFKSTERETPRSKSAIQGAKPINKIRDAIIEAQGIGLVFTETCFLQSLFATLQMESHRLY